MSLIRCHACRWWNTGGDDDEQHRRQTVNMGTCRRYPSPAITSRDYWCGEATAVDPPAPRQLPAPTAALPSDDPAAWLRSIGVVTEPPTPADVAELGQPAPPPAKPAPNRSKKKGPRR